MAVGPISGASSSGSSGTVLWVPSSMFVASSTSVATRAFTPSTAGGVNRFDGMQFDGTTAESASANIVFPDDWSTFTAYAWLLKHGAGAGNVVVRLDFNSLTDGSAALDVVGTSVAQVTVTLGSTEGIVKKATLATAQTIDSNDMHLMRFNRLPADAADTFAGDLSLLYLQLVKAS